MGRRRNPPKNILPFISLSLLATTVRATPSPSPQQQEQQKPLIQVSSSSSSSSWRIYPQDNRTCVTPPSNNSNNTKHFTGLIPIDPDHNKSLFFWFFERTDKPQTSSSSPSPTIIFLNGGPGGSSLSGLFTEIGPCIIDNTTTTITDPNPYSWTSFANLLFLDQPAGTGFSTASASSMPLTLAESSRDFTLFLSKFITHFPEYFTNEGELYIAGESFGGRYISRYISDIILSNQEQTKPKPIKISGIILIDAFIDGISPFLGYHELFCNNDESEYQDILHFNSTTCSHLSTVAIPRAEELLNTCRESLSTADCDVATRYVMDEIYIHLREEEDTGRYTRYDLRLPCELPDKACIPPVQFYPEPYLNRPEVQKLLGFDTPREYRTINMTLNEAWSSQPEIVIPTTRNLSWLLDQGDLRVLVFNGVYDAAITTPGMFREFDHLPWSQRDVFRRQPKTNWYWTDSVGSLFEGGKIKSVPKLHVASVYDAGHMSPGDAKPAVASLVRQWIGL
ncbi:alpha/beta-hydrolase [Poronia punctata]|nr:alpha/beta-hydrolase [Poronia punctata]